MKNACNATDDYRDYELLLAPLTESLTDVIERHFDPEAEAPSTTSLLEATVALGQCRERIADRCVGEPDENVRGCLRTVYEGIGVLCALILSSNARTPDGPAVVHRDYRTISC